MHAGPIISTLILIIMIMKKIYLQPECETCDVLVESPILSPLGGPKFSGESYGNSDDDDDNWN